MTGRLTAQVADGETTATGAARVRDLEHDHDVITVGADELNRAAIRQIRRTAMRALHADREGPHSRSRRPHHRHDRPRPHREEPPLTSPPGGAPHPGTRLSQVISTTFADRQHRLVDAYRRHPHGGRCEHPPNMQRWRLVNPTARGPPPSRSPTGSCRSGSSPPRLRALHVFDEVRHTTSTMYEWHAWPEHRKPPTRHRTSRPCRCDR